MHNELIGEWSKEINAFWLGANGNEYITWKGLQNIFVYDCDDHISPCQIWEFDKRIEALELFNEALYNSRKFKVKYSPIFP